MKQLVGTTGALLIILGVACNESSSGEQTPDLVDYGQGGAGGTSAGGSSGFGGYAGMPVTGGTPGVAGTTGVAGIGQGGTGGEIVIMDGGIDDGGAGFGGATGGTGGATGGTGGTTGGTGGTSGTGGAGTGGTSGTGGCDKPSPPADMQNTIDITWTEMTGGLVGAPNARSVSAGIQNFTNTILDQIASTGGTIDYCVRWDTTGQNPPATASQTLRDKIAAALERQVNNWFSKLIGYDCWPYGHIPVRVTGWATRDRNLLQWQDDAVRIDVNDIRENAPQCMEVCGRFFNRQTGYQFPDCPGGFDGHYDMSLWLTQGMGMGGAGGDWGQRLDLDYFVGAVDADNIHIFLHEFGHGFGLPDYYDWGAWAPGVPAPVSVMVVGSSTSVSEWDGWMLRHTYSQIKSRL